MIQDIYPLTFHNEYEQVEDHDSDNVFIFCGTDKKSDELYVKKTSDNTIILPKAGELPEEIRNSLRYLFRIDDERFFILDDNGSGSFVPDDCIRDKIRLLANLTPMHMAFAEITAYHLFTWYRNNRFCGRCGAPLIHSDSARELHCTSCSNIIYPRIDPAVIIGIIDGENLLVSKYSGRIYKGTALIAGFCEIGESPEDTVMRETLEEVGIRVKNIKYFGSQPWGIDSNLLCGYFCEADGDTTITIDENELSTAMWTKRDELEPMPNTISLTATMIEAFRNGYKP